MLIFIARTKTDSRVYFRYVLHVWLNIISDETTWTPFVWETMDRNNAHSSSLIHEHIYNLPYIQPSSGFRLRSFSKKSSCKTIEAFIRCQKNFSAKFRPATDYSNSHVSLKSPFNISNLKQGDVFTIFLLFKKFHTKWKII